MTTQEAAKKAGVAPTTLLARAKAKGVLPKRVIETGKRGRPGYDWTPAQLARAVGA